MSLESFYLLSLIIQIVHSIEELSTGFHKKWYLVKIPLKLFFIWEISFSIFWLLVFILKNFPGRENLMLFFLALMFANGVQHLVWVGSVKKYVPGLLTAPIHIIVFLVFYYTVLK